MGKGPCDIPRPALGIGEKNWCSESGEAVTRSNSVQSYLSADGAGDFMESGIEFERLAVAYLVLEPESLEASRSSVHGFHLAQTIASGSRGAHRTLILTECLLQNHEYSCFRYRLHGSIIQWLCSYFPSKSKTPFRGTAARL
jgi:hypothetical protein